MNYSLIEKNDSTSEQAYTRIGSDEVGDAEKRK